jgi:hypothetical protein
VTVQSEMERALRVRGYNDGYAGREKSFPKEKVYLDSYANGKLARQRQRGREGGQKGRAATADGSGSRPPARPPK